MGESVSIRFGVDGISASIAQIKELGAAISGMAKEFAAPLTAIASVGAIGELANQFQEYNLQVEKAAQFTGLSAGEVAGLGYAAQRSDTSLEALQQGLKAFSKWLVDTGQGSKNLRDAMLEQADFFQQLGDGAQRNELAVERFGKSGMDLIPVLSRGSAALQDLIERGRDLSGVTEASVKTAREYADAWTDLKVSAEGFVGAAWNKLQPSLAGLFDNLTGGMVLFRKLIEDTNEASDTISNVATKKISGLWTESELDVESKSVF